MTLRLPALLLLSPVPVAHAQTAPQDTQAAPSPSPTTPSLAPPVVPTVTPTPSDTPAATASPAARRRARPPRARPRAAAPTPRTPAQAPVAPVPVPPSSPTPPAEPIAAPPPPVATPRPAPAAGNPWLWPLLAIGAALLALAAIVLHRRRAARAAAPDEPVWDEQAEQAVAAAPLAEPTVTRPRPGLGYRPIRIGLNIVTATVEGEITVTNTDDAAIEGVDVRVALLGVAGGHADVIAGIHREPPARLLAPQFALAPGESKTVRAVAAIRREEIAPLSAGGRPIFVPMVAVTMAWQTDGYDFRSTQAFAVGIERVDSPRLAPVWLDGPSRVHDGVAARAHGVLLG